MRERYPDAFIPRPGLIVGPWDPTGRFTYWPTRLAAGGRVLVPLPRDADAQVIDVRDLAAWIVRAAEEKIGGTYNAVDRPTTARALFETCRRVAGADAELVWVDGDFLAEHEIGEWMELPLWLHDPEHRGMLVASTRRRRSRPGSRRGRSRRRCATRSTGCASGEAPSEPPAGLDREKEQAVLDEWLSKE